MGGEDKLGDPTIHPEVTRHISADLRALGEQVGLDLTGTRKF